MNDVARPLADTATRATYAARDASALAGQAAKDLAEVGGAVCTSFSLCCVQRRCIAVGVNAGMGVGVGVNAVVGVGLGLGVGVLCTWAIGSW